MGHLNLRLAAAAACAALATPLLSAQAPCADVCDLLDALTIPKGGNRILFTDGYGAFFPADSHYDGAPRMRENFRCHLVLDEGGVEVGRWPLLVQREAKVFQRFQPFGQSPIHEFKGAGDFVLSVEFDGEDVTSVPFRVDAEASDDPFDPATTYTIDSGLARWAQLVVSHRSSQPTVGVRFRVRGMDLDLPKGAEVKVTVERQGRVVYDGGTIGASTLRGQVGWMEFDRQLRYPDQKGGGFLPLEDFVKVDGTYRIVLRSGDEVLRGWDFVVDGGKLVPHARSSFDHTPRSEYLLSRVPLPEGKGYEDVVWLEPVAEPAASMEPAPAAALASAATRAAWKPAVALPERAPKVVVTDVAARVDAHLAAGDGVVAYGTGPNTGVSILRCDGDGGEATIPGGAEFSSKWFAFCGTKLVLVKRQEVFVYDTASGSMAQVPDVWLARTPTDAMKGAHIAADGNLVAVLCDPAKVSDRRVVKVIDLSADAPSVIGLGFPDATPRELVSIAVDAAGGTVVLGSDRKSCLFVAPIAADAAFTKLDLSQHDGINRDCAPIVRGGQVAVFDATGSRRLRLVTLEDGSVRTLSGMGKSLRYFDFDGERVALASDVSYGSSYEVRFGAADTQPVAPAGAGESSSYGKAGYGQRVALAPGGLVFTSGHGKSGIGKDEVLLVSDGGAWHAVTRGGAALPAVDATMGQGVLAFKTGKSRDARVGYLLLGRGMKPEGLAGR